MSDLVLAQIGLGLIGQTVISQVLEQRERWERDYGIRVIYRALIDSTGGIACDDSGGYSSETLAAVLKHRQAGGRISTLPDDWGMTKRTASEALTLAQPFGPVIAIDTAAGSRTSELLGLNRDEWRRGHPFEQSAAGPSGKRSSGRAALVAGRIPGSRPLRNDLRGRVAGHFHASLADRSRGHCHPGRRRAVGHPGRDLCGCGRGQAFLSRGGRCKGSRLHRTRPTRRFERTRCARKALILARTIGIPAELDQIDIANLVPESLRDGSVDDFLAGISQVDDAIAKRAEAARANGKRLKMSRRFPPMRRFRWHARDPARYRAGIADRPREHHHDCLGALRRQSDQYHRSRRRGGRDGRRCRGRYARAFDDPG